jgi:hypothetical protein
MKWTETVPLPLAVLLLIVMLWFTAGCSSGEQTLTGTVVKTDRGFMLVTDRGAHTYRLDDNRDMSAMVGKTIKVTGSLMERSASKSITITRFEVVAEDAPGAEKRISGDETGD